MSDKKILVSGVKPTGRPHIGNYFGAMKQFVDLQDKFESRIFVANLHALTSVQNAETLASNSRDVVLDYLAIGLDPTKATIYLQSDVPHVAELAWIFECHTTMPYLMRAHAYKDAEAKSKDINVGSFNYPMLMAADILAADADVVPVGQDQKQHIEIARDTAEKFNRIFGDTFKLPTEQIIDDSATFIGTDGQKMSKSHSNTIPLFATDDEIEKAVMSIVTNSNSGRPEVLYQIHRSSVLGMYNGQLTNTLDDLETLYKEPGKYKEKKEALIKDLKAFIGPLREKRKEWEDRSQEVEKIIAEGGYKMRGLVHEKMLVVREKVGLIHHE
jgi:tryptophanyl-tRNA synthetase